MISEGHVLSFLPPGTRSLADIGCNTGALLLHANELGVNELYGVDINPDAIRTAQARTRHLKNCEIFQSTAEKLPINDATVETVICSEVLEHVSVEGRPQVLGEIHRILKPGGLLILSTPARGFFHWLDPANFRFHFPRIFAWGSSLVGGKGRLYGTGWHQHFRTSELEELLIPAFRVERQRCRGFLLTPICAWLQFPFYRRGWYEAWPLKLLNAIERWEMSITFPEWMAYNIVLVCKKN